MAKLYASLSALVLVFACAMCFATLAVHADTWWPGVVAGAILVVFAALGGLIIPGSTRSLSGGRLRTAKAALQLFGSLCGLLFFMMALITWAIGKRAVGPDNGYLVLGLFIFLGLVGIGIQGVLAMTAWFVNVRNESIVVPAREELRRREALSDEHRPGHGRGSGHDEVSPRQREMPLA